MMVVAVLIYPSMGRRSCPAAYDSLVRTVERLHAEEGLRQACVATPFSNKRRTAGRPAGLHAGGGVRRLTAICQKAHIKVLDLAQIYSTPRCRSGPTVMTEQRRRRSPRAARAAAASRCGGPDIGRVLPAEHATRYL